MTENLNGPLTLKKPLTASRLCLLRSSVLRHFGPDLHISLHVDFSDFGFVWHHQLALRGQWHSATYWFHKCISVRWNYDIRDREMLTIVETMKHCRHYLEGSKFPVLIFLNHKILRDSSELRYCPSYLWFQESRPIISLAVQTMLNMSAFSPAP